MSGKPDLEIAKPAGNAVAAPGPELALAKPGAGGKSATDWANYFKPIGEDVIAKGFKLINEKDYNQFDKLMSQKAFGERTYAFCTVVNAITQTYVASQQAETKRVELLQSFMLSIQESNKMVLQGYQQTGKARLHIKEEANRRYHDSLKSITEQMATINKIYLLCVEKSNNGMILKESLATLDAMMATLDKMTKDVTEVFKLTIDSVSSAKDEDEVLLEILKINEKMVSSFRDVIAASINNSKSLAKTAIETIGNLRNGGKEKQLTQGANSNNEEKKHKPRTYVEYTAKVDFAGKPDKRRLGFKEGDTLYVFKKECKNRPGFFKAAKSKKPGSEVGFVEAAFIKEVKQSQ